MSKHHYFCKGGSFDYEDLEVEWSANCYDGDVDAMEVWVFTPCGREITGELSYVEYEKVLDKCWNEYWEAHA